MRAEIVPAAGLSRLKLILLAILLTLTSAAVTAAEGECEAAGDYRFLCGMQNAEDLVLVPGTHWIIASGMAPAAGMYLIDAQQKSWLIDRGVGRIPPPAEGIEQHLAFDFAL